MAGTNSLEIEIHNLFQEGFSPDYVCRELFSKYDKSEALSPSEIEGLSHFFITCGRLDLLRHLYLNCLKKSKIHFFPVGFFAEALVKDHQQLTENEMTLIDQIIEKQFEEKTTTQSAVIQTFSMKARQLKDQLPKKFQEERLQKKTKLIEQLNQHRQYQLEEQEEAVLKNLIQLFPQDAEIQLLKQAHLEKKADDILNQFSRRNHLEYLQMLNKKDPEVETSSHELEKSILQINQKLKIEQAPVESFYNLAISAFQFELYQACLHIIDDCIQPTWPMKWLKAEALCESGRYLDLLHYIEQIENDTDGTAESTFGCTYLKALSYYGLGKKDIAISFLESLAAIAPHYRATEALLHEWKTS